MHTKAVRQLVILLTGLAAVGVLVGCASAYASTPPSRPSIDAAEAQATIVMATAVSGLARQEYVATQAAAQDAVNAERAAIELDRLRREAAAAVERAEIELRGAQDEATAVAQARPTMQAAQNRAIAATVTQIAERQVWDAKRDAWFTLYCGVAPGMLLVLGLVVGGIAARKLLHRLDIRETADGTAVWVTGQNGMPGAWMLLAGPVPPLLSAPPEDDPEPPAPRELPYRVQGREYAMTVPFGPEVVSNQMQRAGRMFLEAGHLWGDDWSFRTMHAAGVCERQAYDDITDALRDAGLLFKQPLKKTRPMPTYAQAMANLYRVELHSHPERGVPAVRLVRLSGRAIRNAEVATGD